MELNSGELPDPDPPDNGGQEWNAERNHGDNDLTEAELQRLIEQWRQGDREAAERVWSYVYETYYRWVRDKVTKMLKIGLPAREANNDGEEQDEDQQDLDERDMGKDDKVAKKRKIALPAREANNDGVDQTDVDETELCQEDDGEASEPVGVGHGTQGSCNATVRNAAGSSSDDANTQHHDYVMAGGQQAIEDLDLSIFRGVWVTKNTQPGPDWETYTGNYSGRNKLRSREDFEWKGKAAFGKLIKMMWVNRTIDSLKGMIGPQSTAGPHLIEGDLPDPQGFQEAVSSGIRSIDQFMRRELKVVCKEGECLSEVALRAVLNRLLDGEPLWLKPEIGRVGFGKHFKGFKPKTKVSQKRANRAMLVDQYPGLIISVEERVPGTKKWVLPDQVPEYTRLIHDGKERTAGTKGMSPVQVLKSIEEDTLAARADATAGDRQIWPRGQLTMREVEACVGASRMFLREMFGLFELKESLPVGSSDHRLLEGLIIFRKYILWNISPARPALVWIPGTAVTEEELTRYDEIRLLPTEQLIHEADLSIFLDDPCEGGQPLYVQATKFILRYSILDLPESKRGPMKRLENTYVHAPKRRLRSKLERIVPWFYRDKDKKVKEVAS